MAVEHTATVFYSSSGYSTAAIPPPRGISNNMPVRYPLHIAEHRRRLKLTQGKLAEAVGVEQPTIQRWESGTRKPDLEQIGALADALGVDPGELFRKPEFVPLGPRLFLKGEVAAGVWREAYEWPEESWQPFTGRADVTANLEHRFGLRVVGDSMNMVYPHGTIIECVTLFGHAEAVPGRRVVLIREREDATFEATVKLLVEAEGRLWAVPESSNPSFRPVALDEPEDGVVETRISAIVVGSYRPE